MKVFSRVILIAFVFLCLPLTTAAAPDPLFQDDAALNVEITAPFSALLRARPNDPEFAGVFSYKGADGAPVESVAWVPFG